MKNALYRVHCKGLITCKMAERKGLEPSASGVTGRRYNRLNYRSAGWWAVQDLNLRPPPCEGDALPAELTARVRTASVTNKENLLISPVQVKQKIEKRKILFFW